MSNKQMKPKVKAINATKKKKTSWKDVLTAGVKAAIDIAPTLLPLLLASHGPTMRATANTPVAAASAPLAVGSSGEHTGLKGYKVSSYDDNKNVKRVCIMTMDLVTAVSSDSLTAGDVVFDAILSPLDPAFTGTKFAEFVRQYELYRIKRAAFIYEPTCPATTAGGFIGACFADPLVDLTNASPLERQRVASSQTGADSFQPWASGVWSVTPADSKMRYTDPSGSDLRLISDGRVMIVCNSDIAGGATPGQLYLACEFECEVPSAYELAVDVSSYSYTALSDQTTATSYAFNAADLPGSSFLGSGELVATASYHRNGTAYTGSTVTNLPPGTYFVEVQNTGTGLSSVDCFATDEINANGVVFGALGTIASYLNAALTNGLVSKIFSLDAGYPQDVPILGFRTVGTTITLAEVIITKINSGIDENIAGPFPVGLPMLRCKDKFTARQKAFSKTQQYVAYRQAQELKRLGSVLAQMTGVGPLSLPKVSAASLTTTFAPSVPASPLARGTRP